jgi:hypothetical protein
MEATTKGPTISKAELDARLDLRRSAPATTKRMGAGSQPHSARIDGRSGVNLRANEAPIASNERRFRSRHRTCQRGDWMS